jgi:hypothetical protein
MKHYPLFQVLMQSATDEYNFLDLIKGCLAVMNSGGALHTFPSKEIDYETDIYLL